MRSSVFHFSSLYGHSSFWFIEWISCLIRLVTLLTANLICYRIWLDWKGMTSLNFYLQWERIMPSSGFSLWYYLCANLGCTDAAKWPPHPRSTRRRAGDAAACASNRVQFFFFISRFASIWLRRAPTRTEPGRFAPNRIVSAEYRCVSAGKRKSAGEKKKIYLKAKIPVDLMRRCRHIHWP